MAVVGGGVVEGGIGGDVGALTVGGGGAADATFVGGGALLGDDAPNEEQDEEKLHFINWLFLNSINSVVQIFNINN